jgi:signal transduction histidine kinase
VVTLEARVEKGALVLSVADTGIGMPQDKLPEIFEMFAQLDRTHERPYSGLGVGLSLARRLVELHGGTLVGESGGPGQGSRFTMVLPIVPAVHSNGGEPRPEGGRPRAVGADPLSSSGAELEQPEHKPGGALP